jgi:hypothetical protein
MAFRALVHLPGIDPAMAAQQRSATMTKCEHKAKSVMRPFAPDHSVHRKNR